MGTVSFKSAIIQMTNRWHGGGFVRVGFDLNSGVVTDREEVVNNFEAKLEGGVVDAGNV